MNKREQLKAARELLSSYDLEQEVIDDLLASPLPKIVQMTEKFLEKRELEKERLVQMSLYECQLADNGVKLIAGLDEAGCGPLAGPVVAAVVVLSPDVRLWGINDSKKLTEVKRQALEWEIKEKALYWAVAWLNQRQIDRYNILQARLMAMRKALHKLPVEPGHLLIDGNKALSVDIPQTLIVKGDSKSVSVAAASVLAKCERDRIMVKMSKLFPEYGFEINKGYPTVKHRQSIAQYGPSPIHRESFKSKPVRKP